MRLALPKKVPFTLLEVVACSLIVLILFSFGVPQTLARKYIARQIKQAYLAQVSTQNLISPANGANSITLDGYGLCGENIQPWRLEVKNASGETYRYTLTGIPETHWWTSNYRFKPSAIYPLSVTNSSASLPQRGLP